MKQELAQKNLHIEKLEAKIMELAVQRAQDIQLKNSTTLQKDLENCRRELEVSRNSNSDKQKVMEAMREKLENNNHNRSPPTGNKAKKNNNNNNKQNLVEVNDKLAITERDLEATQKDLQSTRMELQSTQKDWRTTQQDLLATQTDLAATKKQVLATEEKLHETERKLITKDDDLEAAKTKLERANDLLVAKNSAVDSLQAKLNNTSDKLQKLQLVAVEQEQELTSLKNKIAAASGWHIVGSTTSEAVANFRKLMDNDWNNLLDHLGDQVTGTLMHTLLKIGIYDFWALACEHHELHEETALDEIAGVVGKNNSGNLIASKLFAKFKQSQTDLSAEDSAIEFFFGRCVEVSCAMKTCSPTLSLIPKTMPRKLALNSTLNALLKEKGLKLATKNGSPKILSIEPGILANDLPGTIYECAVITCEWS